MTKVKKTKKPKSRKTKKPVTKGSKISKTNVQKIDKRLRPTPQPKVESIDKRIKKPLIIADLPRSVLPQNQLPLRMFTGQDTGAILSKQLDVLASKEQQLEGKVTQLQKQNLYEQIIGKMSIIDSNSNILDKNYTEKEYNRLSKQLKEINRLIPKDEPTLFDFYDNLYDKLRNIKNENKMDVFVNDEDLAFLEQTTFKEVKSTNTLLDDKIHNNNLVDEAEILMEEIKSKEIKAPVNLPTFEQALLLGEIKSTEVKGPITLPTFEEAVTVVKKSRGRPKKEKVNELVEVKQTNTLLDDVIVDNILDDSSSNIGNISGMHYNFHTGKIEKIIIPENEDDYEYSIGTGKYTLKSQSPNYYFDDKTGQYEPKSHNRKYEFTSSGYKLRENYVDPSTYLNIPSTFDKPEAKGLLDD